MTTSTLKEVETEAPYLSIDVRDHEPATALFAPHTPLSVIERLADELGELASGTDLEGDDGAGTEDPVIDLLSGSALEFVTTHADLAGIPRVVQTRRRPTGSPTDG